MYTAVIAKITNVRKHPNADRLNLGTVHGNQVVIGLETVEGELGIYFPTDGELTDEFCKNNNLYRHPEKNKDPEQHGMFDDNRRIRTQKFRGEKSDGFWVPVDHLEYLYAGASGLVEENQEFTSLFGQEICRRYETPETRRQQGSGNNPATHKIQCVMFHEHFETQQLARNLHRINVGDTLILTEKVHGTSQRVGHVLVIKPRSTWTRFWDKVLGRVTNSYEWKHLIGTRHTVLKDNATGYYSNDFRKEASAMFLNNLRKGETIYYEVAGYENEGRAIMSPVDLRKANDKELLTTYKSGEGHNMYYSYGCDPGQHRIFVYRITIGNEDGYEVDYSWDKVIERCNELGVNTVPELARIHISEPIDEKVFLESLDKYTEGPSTIDTRHIREGVVIRNVDTAYKHKSFTFKVLEGIVKDTGSVDTEEIS